MLGKVDGLPGKGKNWDHKLQTDIFSPPSSDYKDAEIKKVADKEVHSHPQAYSLML